MPRVPHDPACHPQQANSVLARPRTAKSSARTPSGRIDLVDRATRASLEHSLREALGNGCRLELTVDHDAWAFRGNGIEFAATIAELVRDAGRAMCSPDLVQLSVLNVYDRCGGSADRVLVALSYRGRAARSRPVRPDGGQGGWAAGGGIGQARRFAERVGADCMAVDHPVSGSTVSLLLPKCEPLHA